MLGLESMRDLASLRDLYGFDRVLPIPGLHAAEVSVTAAQLHALLTNAPSDERIRYVALPLGSIDPREAWFARPLRWDAVSSAVASPLAHPRTRGPPLTELVAA